MQEDNYTIAPDPFLIINIYHNYPLITYHKDNNKKTISLPVSFPVTYQLVDKHFFVFILLF